MHVHICPSRTRDVDAANAAMSDQASWVASSTGSGTVCTWSYTQIEEKRSPSSARRARPDMTDQWSAGAMPVRSCRQPWGMKSPKSMATP